MISRAFRKGRTTIYTGVKGIAISFQSSCVPMTRFKLTLMLRDAKHLPDSPVRVGTYQGHVLNRALAQDTVGLEEQSGTDIFEGHWYMVGIQSREIGAAKYTQ